MAMEREPTTWIKLDRNIREWRWIHDPIVLAIWIQLLIRANYKDVPMGNDVVHRGEVYLSQDLLAADIGITKKQLRTGLEKLKCSGEIRAQRRIGKIVVISIPCYDKYQGEGHDKGTIRVTERALKGQHLKKDKKDKNTLSLTPSHKPYHIPTVEEVREYERASGSGKDPEEFFKHYSAEGWKANGKKIYSWKKLYDNWLPPEKAEKKKPNHPRYIDEDGYVFEWDQDKGSYEVVARPNRSKRKDGKQ